MAKVTAPLLSFGGSGQIANTQVYASWRGIPYARRYVIPGNPRTVAQQTTRTTFAMLREMWKVLPTLGRDPWDAFATGRKFLGLNAFIGENMRVIRGEPDMNLFIGSPGARGGVPAESMSADTGAGSGEIDVTFSVPSPPTGWTLTSSVAMSFPDQDPIDDFGGPIVIDEAVAMPWSITLSGLPPATPCQVAGWLTWTKPDLRIAYSVGITDQATSAA